MKRKIETGTEDILLVEKSRINKNLAKLSASDLDLIIKEASALKRKRYLEEQESKRQEEINIKVMLGEIIVEAKLEKVQKEILLGALLSLDFSDTINLEKWEIQGSKKLKGEENEFIGEK